MGYSSAGSIGGVGSPFPCTGTANHRAESLSPAVQETIEIDAPAAITVELGDTVPVRFIRGTLFAGIDIGPFVGQT